MSNDNKQQHNHGAALSGLRGEELLRANLSIWGYSLQKNQDEFIDPNWEGTKQSKIARARKEQQSKVIFNWDYDDGTFQCDGWIPEVQAAIEIKYGTAHGTTEEKIFFDLEKIRDGVYAGSNLIYVFAGTPEEPGSSNRCLAKVFAHKAKKENLDVTVVFARLQKDGSMPGLKEALDNMKNKNNPA